MKFEGDDVVFSTGKTKYAHRGIIGLSPDGELNEGYYGGVFPNADDDKLTPAECVELADYMIQRWLEFRLTYAT